MNKKSVFKKLEKAYQVLRFRDEFDIGQAMYYIGKAQDELNLNKKERDEIMDGLIKEIQDEG